MSLDNTLSVILRWSALGGGLSTRWELGHFHFNSFQYISIRDSLPLLLISEPRCLRMILGCPRWVQTFLKYASMFDYFPLANLPFHPLLHLPAPSGLDHTDLPLRRLLAHVSIPVYVYASAVFRSNYIPPQGGGGRFLCFP
uniref:Uncharacterized protein n=1 Tax=Morchella brunnea TaxID=1174671 RepID=A0A8K1MHA8_9PEZI|nr:hypothetical protein LK370_mgp001 [Morchella brunnea]UBU98475.1 hypothetical protein [Morchella brunnea]